MADQFSDYLVFVDESGDHGMDKIDEHYPVFVLAFCIVRKSDYVESVVPAVQNFKYTHFGHDQIILHETDIRRDRGDFAFLKSPAKKAAFLGELTDIFRDSKITIVSTVIKKNLHKRRYQEPDNPYHVALAFGLERVFYYLRSQENAMLKTHIIVEKRGKREDAELELEFRRVCDGGNYEEVQLPFDIVFADKKSNSVGLQLADLIARPIGLKIIRPWQPNRAYEVIEEKFYRSDAGRILGWGLKCFP